MKTARVKVAQLNQSIDEPCGLGQLISFKYGTIPVVRQTGGLADAVEDYNLENNSGIGFVFKKYAGAEMLQAIRRAVEVYQHKKNWLKLMQKVMADDFSWKVSAREYIKIYQRAQNEA